MQVFSPGVNLPWYAGIEKLPTKSMWWFGNQQKIDLVWCWGALLSAATCKRVSPSFTRGFVVTAAWAANRWNYHRGMSHINFLPLCPKNQGQIDQTGHLGDAEDFRLIFDHWALQLGSIVGYILTTWSGFRGNGVSQMDATCWTTSLKSKIVRLGYSMADTLVVHHGYMNLIWKKRFQ